MNKLALGRNLRRMRGTGNRVVSFAGIVASLALAWLCAHLIGASATEVWFKADLATQSRIAVRALREPMLGALRSQGTVRLDSLIGRLAADQQIIGAAVCTSSDELRATAGLYPTGVLSCAEASSTARAVRLDRSGVPSWSMKLPREEIPAHVTVVELSDGAGRVGSVVLLQSMEELAARRSVARLILFAILAAIVITGWIIIFTSTRRASTRWVRELRLALRGEVGSPEYRPLLKEIRERLQHAEAGNGGPHASGSWTSDRLKRLLRERLRDEHIIVVANREPYIHEYNGEGIKLLKPASGLVTALDPVMRSASGVWIAHGAGSADRESSDENGRLRVPPGDESYVLRRVWMTEEEEQGYYYGFANEGLWPLCHLVDVRPSFRVADWEQYGTINRRFANAVSEESGRDDPIVLVHDYHFALAPRFIRELLPRATVVAFWHIPWPNVERFGIAPWRSDILDGLLGADIVGFHTQAHCNNFIDACELYVEARIDRGDGSVIRRGHRTLVRPYPISIEWPLRALKEIPSPAECRRMVFEELGLAEDAILAISVDRLDYTKGFVERMQAVELLLERRPDLVGRFTLVQLAAPSRSRIPRYRELHSEVNATLDRINSRFARDGYVPVLLQKQHHPLKRILTFYRASNVCYVSSLHDGMNLVAKEFAASRDDERGVLVLSQFAGVSREFTEALIVNPYDVEKASMALEAAAVMSADEQRARMHALRSQLAEFNVYRWAGRMLGDAASLRKRVRYSAPPSAKRRSRVGV